jgi:predicted membrane channel-forming protein YqfA (hemolysin III family)
VVSAALQSAKKVPVSLWVSIALFTAYSALGVIVTTELVRGTDPRVVLALLTVSPVLFVGMIVSVVDIVRTRKRGVASTNYRRQQWVGLVLMLGGMPLWLSVAIIAASR